MNQEPQGDQEYHFPKMGVTIKVPDQGRWVKVIEKPVPPDLPASPGFTPFRVIGNLCVVDYYDENNFIAAFDPPIEFAVAYTEHDLFEAARKARTLKLAYWNGVAWVPFQAVKDKFILLPPSTAKAGEVRLKGWVGDPAIGWGT